MRYCYSTGTCFGQVFFLAFYFNLPTEGRKYHQKQAKRMSTTWKKAFWLANCSCITVPCGTASEALAVSDSESESGCGFILVIRVQKTCLQGKRDGDPSLLSGGWPRCIEFAAGCRRSSRLCSRIACQLQFSFGLSSRPGFLCARIPRPRTRWKCRQFSFLVVCQFASYHVYD